ncbi:MAG: hypothetical protein LBL83_06330, partial [Clostridiales bacterium]|nr:hypothetical protein [Clostridiales bacterium]
SPKGSRSLAAEGRRCHGAYTGGRHLQADCRLRTAPAEIFRRLTQQMMKKAGNMTSRPSIPIRSKGGGNNAAPSAATPRPTRITRRLPSPVAEKPEANRPAVISV